MNRTETFLDDLLFLLPDLFLVFWILYVILMWVYLRVLNNVKLNASAILIAYYGVLGLVLEFFFLLNIPRFSCYYLNDHFVSSELYVWTRCLIIILAVACLLIAIAYSKYADVLSFEFVILYLLAVEGMLLLVTSLDLIFILFCIELVSFSFYVMTNLDRTNLSIEAALKYFVLSGFAAVITLFGCSIIYGNLGTINLYEIYLLLSEDYTIVFTNYFLIIGISALFIGIFFKLGIAPFHFWIADVYEGSPFIVTVFFATVPKIPFFVVLLKLNYTFSSVLLYLNYISIISILGVFSIFLGTIASMYEVKIKRLLAFASIAHMGYVIVPLGLGSMDGIVSSSYYLIIYVFLSIYVFSALIAFWQLTPDREIIFIGDLSKNFDANGLLAFNFAIGFLSMSGIPPLVGFFPKLLLFTNLLNEGSFFILLCVVLLSVLSSVYYIRLIRLMYFNSKNWKFYYPRCDIHIWLIFLIILGLYFNLLFFYFQADLILFLYIIINNSIIV